MKKLILYLIFFCYSSYFYAQKHEISTRDINYKFYISNDTTTISLKSIIINRSKSLIFVYSPLNSDIETNRVSKDTLFVGLEVNTSYWAKIMGTPPLNIALELLKPNDTLSFVKAFSIKDKIWPLTNIKVVIIESINIEFLIPDKLNEIEKTELYEGYATLNTLQNPVYIFRYKNYTKYCNWIDIEMPLSPKAN